LAVAAYCAAAFHFEQALGRPGGQWDAYYSYLGRTPAEALTHPYRLAAGLFTGSALRSLAFWLVGGGFLALWRPRRAIPALAVGLPVLLSHWVGSHQWGLQYDIAPTLFLVAAGIPLLDRQPEMAGRLLQAVAIVSLVAGPAAPFPVVTPAMTSIREIVTPERTVLCLTAGIPRSAGVAASADLVASLAQRDTLYSWPAPFFDPATTGQAVYSQPPQPELARTVDFVVKLTSDPTPNPEGFVLDATAPGYDRLRRATTPAGPPPRCD
jgi:hypothetical protein